MFDLKHETAVAREGVPWQVVNPKGEQGTVFLLPLSDSKYHAARERLLWDGRYQRLQALSSERREELESTKFGQTLLRNWLHPTTEEYLEQAPALAEVVTGWEEEDFGAFSRGQVKKWLLLDWFRDQISDGARQLEVRRQRSIAALGNGSSGRSDGSPATEETQGSSISKPEKPTSTETITGG